MPFGSKISKFKLSLDRYREQLQFYAWFVYPVFVICAIGIGGKYVITNYGTAAKQDDKAGVDTTYSNPNRPEARAQLIQSFLESFGGIENWETYLGTSTFLAGGWILHNEDYRVFEGTKTKSFVEIMFLSKRSLYRSEFAKGTIKPSGELADPRRDPIARALIILLDSYSDENFCQKMFEALETKTLDSVYWNGKPAINLSFYYSREEMEVDLTFEYPDMLLRERVDRYDNGLKVTKAYNGYQKIDGMRLSNSIMLRLDDGDSFEVGLSQLEFGEQPLDVSGFPTRR